MNTQGFTLDDIQLNDEGATGKAYEKSTVISKYYDRDSIPSDEILEEDLAVLLDAYEQYLGTCVFPIKKTDKATPIIPEETLSRDEEIHAKQARNLSEKELEKKISEFSRKPSVQRTVSVRHTRNPYVAELAKRRAKGKCKLCEKEAPFKDADGDPFLEVHHIVWLSKGGEDNIKNAVALCPNCHRKMHRLDLPEDRAKLST